jgi:hypothetical protein
VNRTDAVRLAIRRGIVSVSGIPSPAHKNSHLR